MPGLKTNAKRKSKSSTTVNCIRFTESCGNVFKDMGISNAEAENLWLRGRLMIEIESIIEQRGWTQAQVAKALGVVQPRISELIRGRIDRFSVDTLLRYLSSLGKKVTVIINEKEVA